MLGLKDEITELLTGYLEQVVQADCRRYSLVSESMERMERYLTDYLSHFSKRVGDSIELAIMRNISSLVTALNCQVDQITSLVTQVTDGSVKMSEAGELYFRASKIFSESDFAEKFGLSCESFIQGSEAFGESSQLLLQASSDTAASCKKLAESVSGSAEVTQLLGTSLSEAKENTVQVLSLGIKSVESLREATSAVESIQKRGMTWLSMRAKTDQQLTEVNSQLNDVIANIASVASQVANTRAIDIAEIRQSISAINQIASNLSTVAKQQEQVTNSVLQGLQQMTAVADRVAALERRQQPSVPSS
jgi:methyl-accepting chemotaxis protein